MISDTCKTKKIYRPKLENVFINTKTSPFMYVTMINDNVSVSFSARRSKIERKSAMKTWDKLKATYLIALLHISNEKTAYLFEICRYIKYFQTRTKHLLCLYVALTVVCLISYSSQTRSGTPPPPSPFFYVFWIPS